MENTRSVPIAALGSDQPNRDSEAAPVVDVAERSTDRLQIAPTPPPYWQPSREPSFDELTTTRPPPIALEDHSLSREPSRAALWAKSISIDEYVIVQGNPTGVGAYVVYNINVQTLDGGPMTIRKRYSEFDELRAKLVKAYPQSTRSSLPPLPPKSAIYKFRPKFLEKRREGLAYFLNCVMLNPEYAGSPMVKDFIFPPET
ncbi:hypothetical protein AYL99_02890 [Fonsecaea erecta]|uniref:Endosomal/vacuolar adapter protein YPT35 n=1 Tax=Fonsecaea erecta TaxID=1367422 RepID=A0A178ZWK9_9EURO|nr:hypothetical protein AYL99_02890 [Fonsecaea erecta]OAP63663.1 hypothetical protein AYL99_02890 [Fonsecaea erecta]